MELKFISEEEAKKIKHKGRSDKYPWSEVVAALSARPNEWAELPFTVPFPGTTTIVKKRYKNIRVICKDGDMQPKDASDKKNWRVFMMLEEDN